MEAGPGLGAAIAAARAVETRFQTASDAQLLADGEAVEALGRLVDAQRIAFAAEVERRSSGCFTEERLSFRLGARDGVELVERVTRIDHRDARRRVALGTALAPTASLTGDLLPGRHAEVGDAVASGRIGLEAARVIVNLVKAMQPRVDRERLDEMVEGLIGTAEHADVETLREAADLWSLALDPDGAEPKHRQQRRKRALTIGRTLSDGTTRLSVILLPEHLALLQELLQSRRRTTPLFRTEPGGDDDAETEGPEWREECAPDGGEPRSRSQHDYDTFTDLLDVAARAETADTTAATHEVVITVTADEVEQRAGQGSAAGTMAGLPMPVVERTACTGTTRLMVLGDDGEPLYLSRPHRLFSPAQRKALTLAAGGRCQVPGCRVPAPFLDAHHVEWYARDSGKTHVDNGIMLCSHHHHVVHAKHAQIEIRRHRGDLYIVPANWTGPPDPHHRRTTGPPRGRPSDARAA